MERVPLEPPHPALHGHVSQWPPQTPRVPEENMLVVAATHESQAVCGKAGLRGQGTSQETWTRPSRTQSLPEPPTPTLWFKEQPGLMSQRPQAEAAPQPGLTFPWPTRSHGGGCSGCCTRPWSVCGGGGLSRRPAAPQQKLGAGRRGRADPMRTHLRLLKAAVPGVLVSQPFRRPSSPPAGKQSPSPLVRRHAADAQRPFLGCSHAREDIPTRAGCHRQASPRGSHLCAIVSSHAAEKKGETGATPAREGQRESQVQSDQPHGLNPSDSCHPEPAWLHPSALEQTCLQEAPQTPATGDTFPCVLKRKVPCSLAVKGFFWGNRRDRNKRELVPRCTASL